MLQMIGTSGLIERNTIERSKRSALLKMNHGLLDQIELCAIRF
ncbi:MAG: hypothetical protein ACI9BW_004711, partial [Gammaproteobacteria bacterium]